MLYMYVCLYDSIIKEINSPVFKKANKRKKRCSPPLVIRKKTNQKYDPKD